MPPETGRQTDYPPGPPEWKGIPGTVELLSGVVLHASDLGRTQAFYQEIFQHAGGAWESSKTEITYRTGAQTIGFIRRRWPRTFEGDSGYHTGYRVPRSQLGVIAEGLAAIGTTVEWWSEDAPSEQEVTAYALDPDGNRVQLVAADDGDPLLLDHAAIEVRELDYCHIFYGKGLGGTVDSYHGWRWEDELAARRWAKGEIPSAPWTVRLNPSYRDVLFLSPTELSKGVPSPNTQTFLRYGETRVGMISATKNRQEPRPEILRGTPRLVFASKLPMSELMRDLADRQPLPMERDGTSVFLRDPDGNYVEVRGAP